MRSAAALIDTMMGTARSSPHTSHIQPQNNTETNTAAVFSLAGAPREPRRDQVALERRDQRRDAAGFERRLHGVKLHERDNGADRDADGRPDERHDVERASDQAEDERLAHAEPPHRGSRRAADDRADQQARREVALNASIDVADDVGGEQALLEMRPRRVHDLAFDPVAGEQQDERQHPDHQQLRAGGQRPVPCRQQVLAQVEAARHRDARDVLVGGRRRGGERCLQIGRRALQLTDRSEPRIA